MNTESTAENTESMENGGRDRESQAVLHWPRLVGATLLGDRSVASILTQVKRSSGTVPGYWQKNEAQLREVAIRLHQRDYFLPPRLAPYLRPLSTLRLAQQINMVSPKHILLTGDLDGLAQLLSPSIQVTIWEPEEDYRDYITASFKEGADLERISVIKDISDVADTAFDAALVSIGSVSITAPVLAAVLPLLEGKENARLITRLRSPWGEEFLRTVADCKWEIIDYAYELTQTMLPEGLLLAGAEDVVTWNLENSQVEDGSSLLVNPIWQALSEGDLQCADLAQQPYFVWDFHSLNKKQMKAGALTFLFQYLAKYSPTPEATQEIQCDSDREVGCWYNTVGEGVHIELRYHECHLVATLIGGASLGMEFALQCAVYHSVADHFTVVTPHRATLRPTQSKQW